MTDRGNTLVDGELLADSLKTFGRRFEAALTELAAEGIDAGTLRALATATSEIDRDLDRLYAGKFPKKCNTCGRVYNDHAEYIELTKALRVGGTIFDDEDREVHEYRDCLCGSSLLVLIGDRRDESPFGQRRRQMFDVWLRRLMKRTGRPQEDMAVLLRQVFRAALARARDGEPAS